MQTDKGDWVTSSAQKLDIFVDYFTKLYNSENPSADSIDDFFSHLNMTPDQLQVLETPLSLNKLSL